jgi:uncharacterized protein YjbI with pentapeptide repeats
MGQPLAASTDATIRSWPFAVALVVLAVALAIGWFHVPWLADRLLLEGSQAEGVSVTEQNELDLAARREVLATLTRLTLAVPVIVAAWFAWRRVVAVEQQLAVTREDHQLARTQQQMARDAEATERFTRAIDQLGAESIEVRLGGLLGLEGIARDAEERFAQPAYEVLVVSLQEWTRSDRDSPVGTDVAMVLKILRRQSALFDRNVPALGESAGGPDGAHLADVDLSGASLRGADLSGARLRRCRFDRAVLDDVQLAGARIESCAFNECDITNATFHEATITRSWFANATLSRTSFEGATMTENVRFDGASVNSCVMAESTHFRTSFRRTTLRDVDFGESDIASTFFSSAVLEEVTFEESSISLARFNKATLDHVTFDRATIGGSRITGTLRNVTFNDCRFSGFNSFSKEADLGSIESWEIANEENEARNKSESHRG